MNFETKDGDVFEWQLRGEKVNVFGEAEHVPYDLRTGKDISAGNPELAKFYEPIEDLLSKENMTEAEFDEYNAYLTAHYEHLRKLELGFDSTPPILPEKFDKRLSAENLELLHDYAEKVKKGKMTGRQAQYAYERQIFTDPARPKTQILEGGIRADELDEVAPYGQFRPETDSPVQTGLRATEAPKTNFENVEKLIDAYEAKLSDGDLLNLKKYLTANPDKQPLVENLLKHFDDLAEYRKANSHGAISLYETKGEDYNELLDVLQVLTPGKEPYLDVFFDIKKTSYYNVELTEIITLMPEQALSAIKDVLNDLPEVAGNIENLVVCGSIKYLNADIYDNMLNLLKKYPDLKDKMDFMFFAEKTHASIDFTPELEKNYLVQKQLKEQFPDYADYIDDCSRYFLNHEDIENVNLVEEFNIRREIDAIPTTMNFSHSRQKRLSDCVVGHKFDNDIDMEVLKSQAALIKGLSEIKTEKGSLLDEISGGKLSSIIDAIRVPGYKLDVEKALEDINKLKNLTIETNNGSVKILGSDWTAIINMTNLVWRQLKNQNGEPYKKDNLNVDSMVQFVEFMNKTGYSKKIDNIHSFIENNLSVNIDFIKDVTSKFSDLKFKNDKGEELNFADVIDLKTLTKGHQETLVSNLEFIKENISDIKVNNKADISLINKILNTTNKEIQDGYDLHSYIKDYVFNTKSEPLPPYKNIESNDELNIYLAGFKDENGKTIFDITAAYGNEDLTARSAYELAHQTDLPAEYKKDFLILYGSNTPALNDAISLYGKLNKFGLADNPKFRHIYYNIHNNSVKIFDRIMLDPELKDSPQDILQILRSARTPEAVELYKKLQTKDNLPEEYDSKFLLYCDTPEETAAVMHYLDIDPDFTYEKLNQIKLNNLDRLPQDIADAIVLADNNALDNANFLSSLSGEIRYDRISDTTAPEYKQAIKENLDVFKTLTEDDIKIGFSQVAKALADPVNHKMSDIKRILDLMRKNLTEEQIRNHSSILYNKQTTQLVKIYEMFDGITIKDAKGNPRPILTMMNEDIFNFKFDELQNISDLLHSLQDTEITLNNQKMKLIDVVQLNKMEQLAQVENFDAKKVVKMLEEHPEEAVLATCNTLGKLSSFADYYDRKNLQINELSIAEKRNLMKLLIKYNADLYDTTFQKIINCDLIPHDKDSYCSTLPKIIKSLGLDTTPLTREVKQNYYKAMDSLADPNGAFMKTNLEDLDFKLELTYPRETFISHMQELMKDLTPQERMKATDYFGFEFRTLADGSFVMNGYPVNINNGAKMAEITDPQTKAVIEKMRPYVKQFSENNKIHIDGNPELAAQLNDIIKAFPEFLTTVGKVQHRTHDFTVDVHTLKVMQGVMSNPRYAKLPEADKRALQIATLMHDLTKAENHIDKTHPAYSAFDTYYLLSKMDMPESERLKIYQIIKNHDWLEQYNKKIKNPDGTFRQMTPEEKTEAAKQTAFELRQGNSFEMASILAEADLAGVKRSGEFYEKYKDELVKGNAEVSDLVRQLQESAIHLPQTKIPKASDIPVDGVNVKEVEIDGIKNKVLYLKPDMDLSEYGFPAGTKVEDLNVLVHALDEGEQSAVLQALGLIDSDALLSSSYINYANGNYHVFRTQGFILDVASDDIHVAYYRDFGSGYKKDIPLLLNEYLFQNEKHRDYISNLVKKRMGLSDDEYRKLLPEIADKSITELDETHPDVAQVMRNVFNDMEGGKRSAGRQYNEILITRPKIQGVFFEGKRKDNGPSGEYTIDKVPEFLRQYAADNDLPIIFFGT